VARAFFRCVICGKDGEADVDPDDPATKPATGWIVFLAAYWPAGVAPGPLVLRICGGCYLAALVRSH
jgi:hypothetical protein